MDLRGMLGHNRTHFFLQGTNRAQMVEFEKKLASKQGELVVLFYTTNHGNFFRFGRLSGEELVWDQQALITLPVSEFVTGPEGIWKSLLDEFEDKTSTHQMNIFTQRVPGIDHYPTLLGNYILGEDKIDPRVSPRPSSLEVFIGEEEATRYFKEHEDMDIGQSEWAHVVLTTDGWKEAFLKGPPPPSSEEMDALCEVPEP